jgi:hypothetical protein
LIFLKTILKTDQPPGVSRETIKNQTVEKIGRGLVEFLDEYYS